MPKPLKVLAAVLVACASAAVGWFGVKWWQGQQEVLAEPTTSATPSDTASAPPSDTTRLTFDLAALTAEAAAVMPTVTCGDTFEPEATEGNAITAVARASTRSADGIDTLTLSGGYTTAPDPLGFVATEGTFVVTLDGVVVSPDWGGEYVPQYYVAQPGDVQSTAAALQLTGSAFCGVADELASIWESIDFSTATPEQIAEAQAAAEAFTMEHAALPAGEYKIYMLAPIAVDEPAAIARTLYEEGVNDLGTLAFTIGDSPLGDDPRLEPYCTDVVDGEGALITRQCDVPQDVLMDVIARDVPNSFIVPGEMALAVSEPVVITVD